MSTNFQFPLYYTYIIIFEQKKIATSTRTSQNSLSHLNVSETSEKIVARDETQIFPEMVYQILNSIQSDFIYNLNGLKFIHFFNMKL